MTTDRAQSPRRAPHAQPRRQAGVHASAARTLRDRVAALWGAGVADRMLDVEDVRGAIQVSGLAERPGGRRHRQPPHLRHGERPRQCATTELCAPRRRRTARRISAGLASDRCCSRSSSPPPASTSTCIPPRPRCASTIAGWSSAPSKRRCAAHSAPSTRAPHSACAGGRPADASWMARPHGDVELLRRAAARRRRTVRRARRADATGYPDDQAACAAAAEPNSRRAARRRAVAPHRRSAAARSCGAPT